MRDGETELPALGWLVDIGRDARTVQCGALVEELQGAFAEGIWDGDFTAHGLADAKHLFGSAGYLEPGQTRLLTATSLVDRLIVATSDDRVVVSNSLPLALAATGASLRSDHGYHQEYAAILSGVDTYETAFPVDGSTWRFAQYFYGTVEVDHDSLAVRFSRYRLPASFGSFEDYRSALADVICRLVVNAQDPRRSNPVQLATTLSSGYDSTAVSALAAEAGVKTAFLRKRSSSLFPSVFKDLANDDGSIAAAALGFDAVEIPDRPAGAYGDELEAALLAGGPSSREMAFLPLAAHLADGQPTAVFTGYHGDKVWDIATPDAYLGPDIVRGDISGLPLAEARLIAGFLTVALPFVGAEAIADLRAINRSPDMVPWSVGGDYDRPIPRRIAEEAGVPREAFGRNKRAVWGYIGRLAPRHPVLRRDYRRQIGPVRDRVALWHVRIAQALSLAWARLTGRRRSPVPAWYERSSEALYRESVHRLRDRYSGGYGPKMPSRISSPT
ncbi:hypothetical protein ACI78T_06600 [Blastococcus sp. SYSU D00922]